MITRSISEFGLLLQLGKHNGIPVGVNLYASFAHSLRPNSRIHGMKLSAVTTTMITEKDAQLAPGLPPPYEVEAYVYRRPLFSRSLRRASSKQILFALCVSSLVSYVYFSAGRARRLAAAATDYYGSVAVKEFEASLGLCAARTHFPPVVSPDSRTRNPRWNEVRGQKERIALRNVSLFDGESYLDAPVDIVFSRGLVTSVSVASAAPSILENGTEYNLKGRFVTPGLVDMHSHHLAMAWPGSEALDDVNGMLRSINMGGKAMLTCARRDEPSIWTLDTIPQGH